MSLALQLPTLMLLRSVQLLEFLRRSPPQPTAEAGARTPAVGLQNNSMHMEHQRQSPQGLSLQVTLEPARSRLKQSSPGGTGNWMLPPCRRAFGSGCGYADPSCRWDLRSIRFSASGLVMGVSLGVMSVAEILGRGHTLLPEPSACSGQACCDVGPQQ